MRTPPRSADLVETPLLGAILVADAALEVLVAALHARHPRLRNGLPAIELWDLDLRGAQLAASLARALQATLDDYHQLLRDHAARERAYVT